MKNFKLLGAMLVFLVSLESCKGCAVGAGAGAGCPAGQEQINGACVAKCPADQFRVGTACSVCPAGQIDIDDKKTCKALVAVANKNELVAEIQKATAGGNWTANLNYIDTSKVTDMSNLFKDKSQGTTAGYDLELFNGRIDKWNTSNVIDMHSMFTGATAFNQDISKWNTSNVTNMSFMFSGANAFDQPIGNWNTSNVTDMNTMFIDAKAFDQPIDKWNTSSVTNMYSTFFGAVAFNQPIGNWNVSKVNDMRRMFYGAAAFNQDIGDWKVNKVTDMRIMFAGATAFDKDLSRWNPTAVSSANMSSMFRQTAMETNNNFGKHAPWYCTTTGTKGTGGCPP